MHAGFAPKLSTVANLIGAAALPLQGHDRDVYRTCCLCSTETITVALYSLTSVTNPSRHSTHEVATALVLLSRSVPCWRNDTWNSSPDFTVPWRLTSATTDLRTSSRSLANGRQRHPRDIDCTRCLYSSAPFPAVHRQRDPTRIRDPHCLRLHHSRTAPETAHCRPQNNHQPRGAPSATAHSRHLPHALPIRHQPLYSLESATKPPRHSLHSLPVSRAATYAVGADGTLRRQRHNRELYHTHCLPCAQPPTALRRQKDTRETHCLPCAQPSTALHRQQDTRETRSTHDMCPDHSRPLSQAATYGVGADGTLRRQRHNREIDHTHCLPCAQPFTASRR